MRPPFAYYGGKTRLSAKVVGLMPAHRLYIEPFAGSLAVLLAKAPCTHEVVNDLDGDLVNFWRQLRERPDELAHLCWATPYARDEYAAAAEPTDDDLERARRWWTRIVQSHGRTNTTAGWSTGFARSGSRATETIRSAERIPWVAERLRRVTIENRDALDCIRAYDGPDAVIYVDPPYPAESRNSIGYSHEMPRPEQHQALAETLKDCVGTVLLSGYRCDLYDRLYADWEAIEFPSIRSNGGREGAAGASVEVVWANRTLHEQLKMEPA